MCVLDIVSTISLLPDHSFRSAIHWQRTFKGNEDAVWLSPHAAFTPAYKKARWPCGLHSVYVHLQYKGSWEMSSTKPKSAI